MRYLVLFLVIIQLAACGFTLRGNQPLPPTLQQMSLVSMQQFDPLSKVLKSRLSQQAVNLSPEDPRAAPVLIINDGVLTRRLLSLFSSGQVAEYELIYTVQWQLKLPSEEMPRVFEFELLREYQDDPDQVLAKSREINLILGEMRQQAAQRIMRSLASQQI